MKQNKILGMVLIAFAIISFFAINSWFPPMNDDWNENSYQCALFIADIPSFLLFVCGLDEFF